MESPEIITNETVKREVPTAGTLVKTAPALAALAGPIDSSVSIYATEASFKLAQRTMQSLIGSAVVPDMYRNNLPNALAAYELANRMGLSVQTVMQNLDIIHGRPSWKSAFIVSAVNSCGKFGSLRFEYVGEPGTNEWGCRAYARDLVEGDIVKGPTVTIAIAKKEGWYDRKGSKWQSMPELMLSYRAATWFGRLYAPQILNGMQTADEIIDINYETVGVSRGSDRRAALNARLFSAPAAVEAVDYSDAVDVESEPINDELGI